MPELPRHLQRYPTGTARRALAARFNLPYDVHDQDWEWQIADPAYFSSWLSTYEGCDLSEDERFSLGEMLVQCVEDLANERPHEAVDDFPEWVAIANVLRGRPRLHASTIFYWSIFDESDEECLFRVSLSMRDLWRELERSLLDGATGGERM